MFKMLKLRYNFLIIILLLVFLLVLGCFSSEKKTNNYNKSNNSVESDNNILIRLTNLLNKTILSKFSKKNNFTSLYNKFLYFPDNYFKLCTYSIDDYFDISTFHTQSDGDYEYLVPVETFLNNLDIYIASIASGHIDISVEETVFDTYSVCKTYETETNDLVILFLPKSNIAGIARIAWRYNNAKPLIFEVPHPFYDVDTLKESLYLFKNLRARILILSSIHRCGSDLYSECDGTTRVCSSESEKYRVSDMAHSTSSIFQKFHKFFSREYENDFVFSIHGMGYAGISISNGTDLPDSIDSAVGKIAAALKTEFTDEKITICNFINGSTVPQEIRLCGTSNVQGRFLNNSEDPCKEKSIENSGRFIHMEQSRTVRNNPEKVYKAIFNALN